MSSEPKHLSGAHSLNFDSKTELAIVDTFWDPILRERDDLINEGNNALNQKNYIKENVISCGIFLSTAGIYTLMQNTGFLVKAMEACQILANGFRDVEGPFADVFKILAGQLDNLAMYFDKMIRILGFIAARIEKKDYYLSMLKDQYLDFKDPVFLKEFQDLINLYRTPQAQTHWQTVEGILSSSIMSLSQGLAMSIYMEKIVTATLDLFLIRLKPIIERRVKELVRERVIQESQLRSLKRRDINEKLPLLSETSLYEDMLDILKGMVLGVMRHSREWRIQLLALFIESILTLQAINACTAQLCDKFFISLPPSEKYADADIYSVADLTDFISSRISDIIYSKALNLAGKAVTIIPQVLYRKYQENEGEVWDQKQIELTIQRLDDVDFADRRAAEANRRCVHDAVAESLGVNSKQLADASGLGASERGASQTDIERLYAQNGIKTKLCSPEEAFNVLQTQQSDRGVACFKGPDGMGHAVALYYKKGQLIVQDQGRETRLDDYKNQYGYSKVELVIPRGVHAGTLSEIQSVIARNRIVRAPQSMAYVDEIGDEDFNFGVPKHKKNAAKQEQNQIETTIYIDPGAVPTTTHKRAIKATLEDKNWRLPNTRDKNVDGRWAFRCDHEHLKKGYEIQKNDIKGNTTIAVVHYPENLWKVVSNAPNSINGKLDKEVHDIIKQKLIDSLNLQKKIYLKWEDFPEISKYREQRKEELERSNKHKGVPEFTAFRTTQIDYWLDYSKKALIHLLELRLKTSLISPERVIIMRPCVIDSHLENINFPQQLNEILAKIVQYCSHQDDSQILLLPLLIQQSEWVYHWVGIVVEKKDMCINLSYLDSENQAVSIGFQEALTQGLELAYPDYQIHFFQRTVESQRYNNCGSELIENFIQYLIGTRVSQEEAIELHQFLGLQDLLLQSCDSEASFPNAVDSRESILPEDEEEVYALSCVDASLSSEKTSNARVFPVFGCSLYSFFSADKNSPITVAQSEKWGLYNSSP